MSRVKLKDCKCMLLNEDDLIAASYDDFVSLNDVYSSLVQQVSWLNPIGKKLSIRISRKDGWFAEYQVSVTDVDDVRFKKIR